MVIFHGYVELPEGTISFISSVGSAKQAKQAHAMYTIRHAVTQAESAKRDCYNALH